ncbi:MAG: DUF2897 family protein [Glaciecola sp.]
MTLSTGWVITIIVVVLAVIVSSITALKKSNKPFEFPEGYENPASYDKDDEDNESDKG